MQLSLEVIKNMGFTPIDPTSPITATFQSLNIYHIEGLSLSGDPDYTCYETGTGIRFCFGNDINEICKALVHDTWTDTQEDQDEWQKSRNATPPYLAVSFRAQDSTTVDAGFWVRYGPSRIHTFDTFKQARLALQKAEGAVLPQFLFLLSGELSSTGRAVYFRSLARHVDGTTPKGETVVDLSMTMIGNVSVTASVQHDYLANAASATITRLTGTLSNKALPLASQWFQKGIDEIDSFNKFRCFFVVIEKLTKELYPQVAKIRTVNDLLATRLAHLVPKYQQQITAGSAKKQKPIFLKFLWGAALHWTHLSDTDIEQMDAITELRNKSFHGDVPTDEVYPHQMAQELALKLLT